MAALVVQSRFAGLKIEDDDLPPSEAQKAKKKITSTKKPEALKKPKPTKEKETKPQSAGKKKKSKTPAPTAEQWEQWKQKDEELVDGNFESELHQAILLSKLDYEENKDLYKKIKKDEAEEKKTEPKNSKKQKKKVMSLDQFNDMVTNLTDKPPEEEKPTEEQKSLETKQDAGFFERVKDEAKSELLKDKINDRVRNRKASYEILSKIQFADTLEKKENEIAVLRAEVVSLKQELLTVKNRNKKLCNILGQGEMRDKAEVLLEAERLRGVQAELTAELAVLHEDLERERSRHERVKDKKKKGASGDRDK